VDLFLAKKVLAAFVLPPTGPLLVAIIGLLLLNRRPAWGRALAWLGVLTLAALSLPVVSHALLRFVEQSPPLDLSQARDSQAIVILGGGVRRAAPEYGGDTLGRLTLERVRYGALLARRTKLPVLVTGGAVHGGTAEAVLMKNALEEEYGVEVAWTEPLSRNTETNAQHSAALLLPAGIRRVLLVGHGFDMRRATAEFASAGLQAIPAPTVMAAGSFGFDHPIELLPSMSALQTSYYALYELLAEAVRRLSAIRPFGLGSAFEERRRLVQVADQARKGNGSIQRKRYDMLPLLGVAEPHLEPSLFIEGGEAQHRLGFEPRLRTFGHDRALSG
jgi:uncharacterized SAM-binding protein YcdF (DUF218 family)